MHKVLGYCQLLRILLCRFHIQVRQTSFPTAYTALDYKRVEPHSLDIVLQLYSKL
ncbi:hypothetical protein ACE6H2_005612 [Prunus campanulata]